MAPIVGQSFSTEDARDRVGEAEEVMRLAEVGPGMSVADIGAGEGYYTVRLSPIVGRRGRVLAEDIVPETRDRLAARVEREHLDNVSVKLGTPADPMLPASSFDRIFLVHMYHEVTEPYEFLWNLRQGLKPEGLVVVVDSDRPVKRHGMPPRQLVCEFAALGMAPAKTARLTHADAYFIAFRISAPRPEPGAIKPCVAGG
ncbi:MAG TPA: methyltransferase domain-containing protein [Sphingomicrobium sp.]|nr:methyltransferase domain-containing protein [Sphingomicrobium sp.]